MEVVRLIGEGTQEIFVAGDDDQSIYGFRHADPLAIGRFTDDYHPSVRLDLTDCYRCGSAILAYAEFVLAGNLERVQKRVTSVPEAGRGEIHVLRAGDQTDEVVNIAQIVLNIARNREWVYDQFLILMRNDYNSVLSRSIISALRDLRIPASDQQDPLQPLDTPDGRTILSILELAVDGNDQLAWRAVFENRRNRIGERTLLEIHSDAASQSDRFRDALDRRCQSDSRVSREFEKLTAVITEIRPRLTEIRTAISIISSRLSITPSNAFNSLIADTVADSGTEDTSVFLRIIRTDWRDQEDSEDGSVRIMTMHRAKGLEAKCVFIVSCDDQTIPGGNTIDEERRLLYVSLTRAKELLFVTWAVRREGGQQFTGARPGNPMRTLSTLLSDGPVRPVSIQQYVREFGR